MEHHVHGSFWVHFYWVLGTFLLLHVNLRPTWPNDWIEVPSQLQPGEELRGDEAVDLLPLPDSPVFSRRACSLPRPPHFVHSFNGSKWKGLQLNNNKCLGLGNFSFL